MAELIALESSGFEEVDHTADWAYRIWGPNLEMLFIQAARGLYALAGVQFAPGPETSQAIRLHGIDAESLLVAWLNELLYLHESQNLGLRQVEIQYLDQQTLQVEAVCVPTQGWLKCIKAVTYNNLAIQKTSTGLEATLVLDV